MSKFISLREGIVEDHYEVISQLINTLNTNIAQLNADNKEAVNLLIQKLQNLNNSLSQINTSVSDQLNNVNEALNNFNTGLNNINTGLNNVSDNSANIAQKLNSLSDNNAQLTNIITELNKNLNVRLTALEDNFVLMSKMISNALKTAGGGSGTPGTGGGGGSTGLTPVVKTITGEVLGTTDGKTSTYYLKHKPIKMDSLKLYVNNTLTETGFTVDYIRGIIKFNPDLS